MTPPDFPAGEYVPDPSPERRADLIAEIETLPAKLRAAVAGANPDRIYKKWTVRQIAHHLADSHVNAYARFRLALTEDWPAIKPYDESRWVELADSRTADIGLSLALLDALHARWVVLLRALTEADYARGYVHPQYGRRFTLAEAVSLYAHHGRHHTAQIDWLRASGGA